MDQCLFAAPHGLSQRTTSFIASQRQGIHQIPLRHLIALIIDAQHRNPCGVRSRSHRRVAVPRRYGPAIKTYAFFRTCPGREAVKLPVISPAGPCGPRGGVDPSVGATRQASPVARPEPHGRTHSLFTMSKNTPQAKARAMRQPAVPVANGDLRTMAMGL